MERKTLWINQNKAQKVESLGVNSGSTGIYTIPKGMGLRREYRAFFAQICCRTMKGILFRTKNILETTNLIIELYIMASRNNISKTDH